MPSKKAKQGQTLGVRRSSVPTSAQLPGPSAGTVSVQDAAGDTAEHPTARYMGKFDSPRNGVPTRLAGELTLRGVTRPVNLDIAWIKCATHPLLRREVCGADASGSFNRDEFGLGAGKDYGFKMAVDLRIQVEALAPR